MRGYILKNFLIAALFLSVSVSAFSKAKTEKIIDDNDLVIVDAAASNVPLKYQKIVNAFGVIQFIEKDQDGNIADSYYGCTGTHLGRGYVITAGHCVGATEIVTSQANCNMGGDDSTVISEIHFGYRENVSPFMKSKCTEVVAAMKNDETGYDFAILKISPYPEEFILPDTNRRAATGDTVTIFSHPMGEVLQWSKTCGIEYSLHPEIPGSFIQHKCDTQRGSSGAAIINALTLKIVGVHDGGMNDFDLSTGRPLKTGMNYGTYILNSPLYEELKKIGF
jgi:V8-like Glu-specific endopeptidase